MKYFIVTKKHINILKITVASILGISIVCAVLANLKPKAVQTFSTTDILKSELPKEDESVKLSEIPEKILGFSINDPASVISDFSPAFDDVKPEKSPTAKPQATVAPTPEAASTPEPEKHHVEEKTIKGSSKIKNETKYEVTLEEFENEPINLSGEATVLIVHTHTTESYAPEDENMYFINDNSRSTDNARNMIAIGEVISGKLREQGINVIHDTTFHDYPVYNGAYGRSLATVKSQQEKNSGINVVLDIHRDAVVAADGTQTKVIADIKGQKAAQIMLVVGTNGSGLKHPSWMDNLTFASKIQALAEKSYPGLMRPLNLREERFNQHTTPCSIIIEVGTNANTLSEAKTGAGLVGECIANVLK